MRDLMQRLVSFETVPDAPPVGAGAPDPGTSPESAPGTTAPATEPTQWSGPSQDEWQQTQQALQQMGQVAPFLNELQQLLADEPQQQPGPGEQFDPEVERLLQSRMDQMWQERFGAFEPVLGQIAEREGEQIARSTLDKLATEGGEFNRDLALLAAQQYVANMPPDQALRAAAEYARTIEKQVADRAISEHQAALAAAAGAPSDVGAPGAAVSAPTTPTGRDRYEEAMARFASRANPVQPTG